MKKLAIRGTFWTIISYGAGNVLRLGSNLILTRLLAPELFGLMALVSTFIQGLALFSDIGITPNIVRSPRGEDPVFLNTAWTLQVVRGLWLWVGCCIIAFPVAYFYGDSRLSWLIPIVGFTAVMGGFNSTSLATLNRRIEVGKLTLFRLGVQVLTLTIMVIWAYFHRSIWALVVGNLVSSFIELISSHRLEPGISNRFAWDQESLKEIISFGRWIFISTAMTFLAEQADRLMLGKLLSFEILGIYTIAATFSYMPGQIISALSSNVIFPLISQHLHLPREQLRSKIIKKRWFLLVGIAIIIAFLFCWGDLIIISLYDERYRDAAWMLPILALGILPNVLMLTIDRSLIAIGKPLYTALGNFFKFLYMLIALPLGYFSMGIFGAIVVVAFNDLTPYLVTNYGLWKEGLLAIGQDIKVTMLIIGLITLMLAIRYFLGLGLPLVLTSVTLA